MSGLLNHKYIPVLCCLQWSLTECESIFLLITRGVPIVTRLLSITEFTGSILTDLNDLCYLLDVAEMLEKEQKQFQDWESRYTFTEGFRTAMEVRWGLSNNYVLQGAGGLGGSSK